MTATQETRIEWTGNIEVHHPTRPTVQSTSDDKLAAIIVLLDPFERVANWMTTDEDAGRYAIEAINKIRGILDTP